MSGAGGDSGSGTPGGGDAPLTKTQLAAVHAAELKELKSKIKAMGKESRKAKKEAQVQGPKWTAEMKARHKEEMEAAPSDAEPADGSGSDGASGEDGGVDDILGGLMAMSADSEAAAKAEAEEQAQKDAKQKAEQEERARRKREKQAEKSRKRRERKAAKEAEREAELEKARAEAPDHRQMEIDAIQIQLDKHSLTMKTVRADGNCLFHAVADQLQLTGEEEKDGGELYKELRRKTADYLAEGAGGMADFLEFTDEDLATGNPLQAYTERLRTTAMWGGEPELRSLAAALGLPIRVFGAAREPLVVGPEAGSPMLNISFHEKYYALGDHYNSVIPK